jgi:hypothetical protein
VIAALRQIEPLGEDRVRREQGKLPDEGSVALAVGANKDAPPRLIARTEPEHEQPVEIHHPGPEHRAQHETRIGGEWFPNPLVGMRSAKAGGKGFASTRHAGKLVDAAGPAS